MEWESDYAFKKILPLSTRWQLINNKYLDFLPEKILKKKVLKGVPSYEILWSIKNEGLTVLIQCNENENEEISTIEPQILITEKLNHLHENYIKEIENEKTRKKEEKKKEKAKKTDGAKVKKKEKQPKIDSIIKGLTGLSLGNPRQIESSDVNIFSSKNTEAELEKTKSNESYFLEEESSTSDYEVCNYLSKTINLDDSEIILKTKDKFEQSSFYCTNCDDSTVDYEINESLIVESILSRKQFY